MRLWRVELRLLAAFSALGGATANAQGPVEQARADVRYLAQDAWQGRGVGTAGLDSAAVYLARRFEEIGLQPAGTKGYFQPFEIDPTAPAVAHSGIGAAHVTNMVGILPGAGPLASETVVLGAHYDHLGLGGMGSLDPDSTGVVHNGADDNASGTAALLQTARILERRTAPSFRTIVFVAFTAEELGLIGSNHYVGHPARPNSSTVGMINFDMVGRLRGDSLQVIGSGSAEELRTLLERVNRDYRLHLSLIGDPWGRSDHSSFYAAEIPVVHFFTNTHEDYHRTTDDWQKVNAQGVVTVARFAADLAWELATRRERLAFVAVHPPQATGGGGYGAYLGTIPDMSESPGGVRLTGVREGSPAAAAGLQAGDVLVRIGDMNVKDLYDMTEALRSHAPGDVVKVVFLRDGERHEVTATLGTRGG
jgi:hypothetical protein